MIKRYDREKAISYAQKWALGRNSKYYSFDNVGGDCTNFISQCLLEGGAEMDFDKYYGWFYISAYNRSPSWASVVYLSRYLLSEKQKGIFAIEQQVNKLQIGDIIQLKQTNEDFNHSLIISQKTDSDIYICAHDNNALNRPLSSYHYIMIRGIHIEHIIV